MSLELACNLDRVGLLPTIARFHSLFLLYSILVCTPRRGTSLELWKVCGELSPSQPDQTVYWRESLLPRIPLLPIGDVPDTVDKVLYPKSSSLGLQTR